MFPDPPKPGGNGGPHASLLPAPRNSSPPPTADSTETKPWCRKSFTLSGTGPPQSNVGSPSHPTPPQGTKCCCAPQHPESEGGVQLDGKGLDPFNHHFLLAGTKPPLTGWKRTSIFLLGFIQCQKAFTASARVLGMQRQRLGQAGSQPPSQRPHQHPAPGGGKPRTPPARTESHGGRGEGWGPRQGLPSSGLILLGSSTAQSWLETGTERGVGSSCVPQLQWGLLNQILVVLARKTGMQVPASPCAPSSASLQQSISCNHPGKALQIPN